MSIERAPAALAVLSLLVAALVGCEGTNYTPPPEADPATARAALEKALDCWRLRIDPAELAAAQPAITVADEDWLDGRRLVAFQLLPGEQALGTSIRWPVRLKLADAGGHEQLLDAIYVVSTHPIIHISRRD